MKIELEDIVKQEATALIADMLKNGSSLQSAKQHVNSLLTNVDITSDSSVSSFISIIQSERRRLK